MRLTSFREQNKKTEERRLFKGAGWNGLSAKKYREPLPFLVFKGT
jgi:hypothetical protein